MLDDVCRLRVVCQRFEDNGVQSAADTVPEMKLLGISIIVLGLGVVTSEELSDQFKSSGVVPDVLATPPGNLLQVSFNGKPVNYGKQLTPTEVKDTPLINWNAKSDVLYTVCMTDPDAPSRQEPKFREFLHWLVVNVPGADIAKGETLAGYVGSGPPKGTGLHRYVLLVYQQPGKIDVSSEKHTSNTSRDGRPGFAISKFAEKYGLGSPIAGNMYQAQYDDYVPILHKQLSD